MGSVLDVAAWRELGAEITGEFGATLAAFLPKLAAGLVIVAVGYLAARLADVVLRRLLRRLGVDRAAARFGLVGETLERGALRRPPSAVAGRLAFWIVLLAFLLSGVETLGLVAVGGTLDRLVALLPGLLAAAVIVILGIPLSRFVRDVAISAGAAAGLDQAERLGAATRALVLLVVAIGAAEQLGIDTAVVVSAVAALLAALGVSAGVALALGARPVVTHILAGHFLRQSLPLAARVEVDGRRGIVERVGPVDTLLREGERTWSIPNGRLLDCVIERT